jgi:hypothetical protein
VTAAARHVCPCCHGTGYAPQAEPSELVEQLRDTCRERGTWISPDDRVRESAAAELLGLRPKTLENWRANGARLPFIKRAGRPLYALADLAAHIASSEN